MAKPEKRWQLLLVADDGRIIPFKRIKGIAVALVVILFLLGVLCAGLGWQLIAEKVRHRNAQDRLADAKQQVARYKNEHELITAELVLAQARMEKAGLLLPEQPKRSSRKQPVKKASSESAGESTEQTHGQVADAPDPKGKQTVEPTDSSPLSSATAALPAKSPHTSQSKTSQVAAIASPPKPAVFSDDLKINHDAGSKTLHARFRVKNNGPRSSPVAGRCVVVLQNHKKDPTAWFSMPEVPLANGKPKGTQGAPFKIANYRTMDIKSAYQADPSAYTTAIVYIFDASGKTIHKSVSPIEIPAPVQASVSTPALKQASTVEINDSPVSPPTVQEAGPGAAEDEQSTAFETTAQQPATTDTSPTDGQSPAEIDDPSLMDAAGENWPADDRSRF